MREKKKKIERQVDVVEDLPDDSPEKAAVMLKCNKLT